MPLSFYGTARNWHLKNQWRRKKKSIRRLFRQLSSDTKAANKIYKCKFCSLRHSYLYLLGVGPDRMIHRYRAHHTSTLGVAGPDRIWAQIAIIYNHLGSLNTAHCTCNNVTPAPTAGFVLTPNELGSRGPNAAKNYLNRTPFGFRPLQLVVRGGVYR